MRLGVLDVGSNTVHLLVVDTHRGAPPVPQASHKSVLRLMRYLEPSGAISPEGVRAVVDAVAQAVKQGAEAGIDTMLPLAKSALRESPNGPAATDMVPLGTGVQRP